MKIASLWDVVQCSLVYIDWYFRGAYCLHYHVMWCTIPENSQLHTHCENLKFYHRNNKLWCELHWSDSVSWCYLSFWTFKLCYQRDSKFHVVYVKQLFGVRSPSPFCSGDSSDTGDTCSRASTPVSNALVLSLAVQVNALQDSNKQLYQELRETKAELETLKQSLRQVPPEYEPGMLSGMFWDLVILIMYYSLARLKTRRLKFAWVKYISTWANGGTVQNITENVHTCSRILGLLL